MFGIELRLSLTRFNYLYLKFEQTQLIADLTYVLKLISNEDLELPDRTLEEFLKHSRFLKKNTDKHIKFVNKQIAALIDEVS
jgi:hypothetical protein